jgi:hypothetical protein
MLPGNDTQQQIELIFTMFGSPSQEEIDRIPNPRARKKVMDAPKRPGRTFDAEFRDCNPLAVDLLR